VHNWCVDGENREYLKNTNLFKLSFHGLKYGKFQVVAIS